MGLGLHKRRHPSKDGYALGINPIPKKRVMFCKPLKDRGCGENLRDCGPGELVLRPYGNLVVDRLNAFDMLRQGFGAVLGPVCIHLALEHDRPIFDNDI
jgi:hypothetical protein